MGADPIPNHTLALPHALPAWSGKVCQHSLEPNLTLTLTLTLIGKVCQHSLEQLQKDIAADFRTEAFKEAHSALEEAEKYLAKGHADQEKKKESAKVPLPPWIQLAPTPEGPTP